ncbi:MAG: P-II family nitrogen regulator [Planctomycetota bacterium]
MKLIQAILPPDRLEAVQQALSAAEVYRMTVGEAQGLSLGEGALGEEDFAPEPVVVIEIAVNENFVKPTIQAIRDGGGGAEGGGKIFVTTLADVVRIRTGERGPEAI